MRPCFRGSCLAEGKIEDTPCREYVPCSACCVVFPGLCVSVPRAEDGRPGASRVRPRRGGLQIAASVGKLQPVVRHLGGKRGGKDGNNKVYSAVPVFCHQQCQHVGGAADTGGEHDIGGFRYVVCVCVRASDKN